MSGIFWLYRTWFYHKNRYSQVRKTNIKIQSMNETGKVTVGEIHRLQLRGEKNIIEAKVIRQIRDIYLCKSESTSMYYHIKETGDIVVYVDESDGFSSKNVKYSCKCKNGIFILDVDLLQPIIFLFEKEPIESLKNFLVFDMYRTTDADKIMLTKNGSKAQIYEVGVDRELDVLWREARAKMED